MSISVYAHIQRDAEVKVELRDDDAGRYAVLESGGLAVFINDREQALEIASLLEQAAQEWEGEGDGASVAGYQRIPQININSEGGNHGEN